MLGHSFLLCCIDRLTPLFFCYSTCKLFADLYWLHLNTIAAKSMKRQAAGGKNLLLRGQKLTYNSSARGAMLVMTDDNQCSVSTPGTLITPA
jgi:hypothetical protein